VNNINNISHEHVQLEKSTEMLPCSTAYSAVM